MTLYGSAVTVTQLDSVIAKLRPETNTLRKTSWQQVSSLCVGKEETGKHLRWDILINFD